MLHELSHNVHGPHDDKFQALWDQLRKEAEELIMKGYTGEGFLGKGNVIGGSSSRRVLPPPQVLQKQRRSGQAGGVAVGGPSGHRLGGSAASPGDDIRAVIARAAETRVAQQGAKAKKSLLRRSTWFGGRTSGSGPQSGAAGPSNVMNSTTGCGNVGHSDREIIEIVDDAESRGFRTKAEEDEANDAAIARAVAEEWAAEDSMQLPVPAPGQWACPQCTLLNAMLCKTCQVCEFRTG
jgi:DNA-dependent metalloprotease WSS1